MDVKITGWEILGQARLSQGVATAPRTLFVGHSEGKFVVAEYYHDSQSWGASDYIDYDEAEGQKNGALVEAYERFAERLIRDTSVYLASRVPLTGWEQEESAAR